MRRHVMEDPTPLHEEAPNAPPDLTWAIMRCLDKDPTRRWPTAQAFRQALESGDDSWTDLPEPLEHLAGRAVRVVAAGWVLAFLAALGWARTGSPGWIVALLGIPLLVIASIAPAYVLARRFGLTDARIGRLLSAPSERWASWWPSPFRRSGDVWERLPASVRRARVARSAALFGTTAVLLPLLALSLVFSTRPGAATPSVTLNLVLVALFTGLFATFGVLRSAALRELSTKRVPVRIQRKWLSEPTWGSNFWRRSEVGSLLTVSPSAPKPTVDKPGEDPYCITTPTQPELPHGMFDHVDPRSPTPLYAQIASRLRVAIASGELQPGNGLPSVRQLSAQLRINPATVVQAYRELEVEGLVSTRQGAGTFVQEVAADRRNRDREKEARRLVRDLLAQAGSIGITAGELRAAMDQELKVGTAR